MKVCIIRHGQPLLDGLSPNINAEFPPGDFPLSNLGRMQAAYLGRYLKNCSFSGRVISSPYIRTAETASIICKICGITFDLEPAIQEKRCYISPGCTGMSLQQLISMFPEISKETVLPSSWIIQKQEPPGESEAFLERVNSFLSRLIGSVDNRDILLVGHGATVKAMCRFFCRLAGAEESQQQPWNCSLSEFYRNDSDSWYVNFQNDISFLPRKIVTSNSRRLLDEFDND